MIRRPIEMFVLTSTQAKLLPPLIKKANLDVREQVVSYCLSALAKDYVSAQACFLAVYLLDCVLGKRVVAPKKDKLLAAILIKNAGTYEDNSFTDRDIGNLWTGDQEHFRHVEREVLEVLEYEKRWKGPLLFVNELSNNLISIPVSLDNLLPSSAETTAFILKVSLFNSAMALQLPSLVAAAAHCLAVSIVEEALLVCPSATLDSTQCD